MECGSFVLVAYVRIAFRLPSRERFRDELKFSSHTKNLSNSLRFLDRNADAISPFRP
jgi:hypothetical protein